MLAVAAWLPDNATVDEGDPSAAATGSSPQPEQSPAPDPLAHVREQFLTQLLQRFESGALEAYEYSRRVRAIELATSAVQMADIVLAPAGQEPTLDAVDMMRMARASSTVAGKDPRVRYIWLVVMVVGLVVLTVVGLWLADHAKAIHDNPGGVVGALVASAVVAGAALSAVS